MCKQQCNTAQEYFTAWCLLVVFCKCYVSSCLGDVGHQWVSAARMANAPTRVASGPVCCRCVFMCVCKHVLVCSAVWWLCCVQPRWWGSVPCNVPPGYLPVLSWMLIGVPDVEHQFWRLCCRAQTLYVELALTCLSRGIQLNAWVELACRQTS